MSRTISSRSTRGRVLDKTLTKRNGVAAALLATSALTLAACGSSGSTGAGGGGNASPAAQAGQVGIHVAKTSLGKVLVDPKGFTVYMFTADKMNKSNCDAACLHFWPSVNPQPSGMKAAGITGKFGSTKTPTGSPIATINGMPLYTFSGDHAPGDVQGQNVNKFGGRWYVVSPAGQPIKSASSSGGSGGGGGGGGYSY